MNQFRTFASGLCLLVLLLFQPAVAKLQRQLKLSEIKVLTENVRINPKNIKSRLFLADHYFDKGQWQETIDILNPVIEEIPDHSLYQVSHSYFELNKVRQALAIVEILLSRPQVKTEHRLLAVNIYGAQIDSLNQSLQSKEWLDKLIQTLKEAQAQDPSNRQIYEAWLASLEKYMPEYATWALRVMEDMQSNQVPLRPKDYSRLCQYNHMANFPKAAKVSCNQALIKDPGNPSNLIYLGQSHIENGDEKTGKRMLASVGKKFSDSEEALWATANSYLESKNISAAYQYFKKASAHKEAQPRSFLGLAKAAFQLKKYEVSLQAFVEHCQRTKILDQEFRRASGLLKNSPRWQYQFRQKMMDCQSK